jgi:flagella basal body P-ring formation protein FlgA
MKLPRFVAIFAAVLLCLPCISGPGHAETVITMKDSAVIDDARVLLGDIASISGASPERANKLARLEITSAPKPGHSKQIDRDFTLARLHHKGLGADGILFTGARCTSATRSSQSIPSDKLAGMLRSYIETRMPWTAQDTVIEVQPPPSVDGLPSGKAAVTFECDGDYRYVGDTSLKTTIKVDGKRCRTLYLRAGVHPFTPVAVAVKNIKRGEPILESDFSMVKKDLTDLRRGFFVDKTDLNGLVAARSIAAGAAISLQCVERPIAVKRGKIVVAEIKGKGFRITAMAKAMDNGRVGDVIRLTNVDSRRTFTGEVVDESTVRVLQQG